MEFDVSRHLLCRMGKPDDNSQADLHMQLRRSRPFFTLRQSLSALLPSRITLLSSMVERISAREKRDLSSASYEKL